MEYTARMNEHALVSRAAAAGSCVLLKNVANTLPFSGTLDAPVRVAVFGIGQIFTPTGLSGMDPWRRVGILDGLSADSAVAQDTLLALIDIINAHKKHVWVRHVVVPDINDTPEDMEALNVFMKKIRFVDKVELLGYHTMAVEKYGKLGITYRLKGVPPMDSAKLMELQKLIHKPAEAVTRMSL